MWFDFWSGHYRWLSYLRLLSSLSLPLVQNRFHSLPNEIKWHVERGKNWVELNMKLIGNWKCCSVWWGDDMYIFMYNDDDLIAVSGWLLRAARFFCTPHNAIQFYCFPDSFHDFMEHIILVVDFLWGSRESVNDESKKKIFRWNYCVKMQWAHTEPNFLVA